MLTSNSELHLRRARSLQDPQAAIAEYLKAIDEAVRELIAAPAPLRTARR